MLVNPEKARPGKKEDCLYHSGYLSRFSHDGRPDCSHEDKMLHDAAAFHCGINAAVGYEPELPKFCGGCQYSEECIEEFMEYSSVKRPRFVF